jgi:enoyl-[acyl-carrier protein] reductase/trans-2-enoyl-CoA reductase (NAD+)
MHLVTGNLHRSVLKSYLLTKQLDFHPGKALKFFDSLCSGDDIENTVAVMGGEDCHVDRCFKSRKFIGNQVSKLLLILILMSLTEAV